MGEIWNIKTARLLALAWTVKFLSPAGLSSSVGDPVLFSALHLGDQVTLAVVVQVGGL